MNYIAILLIFISFLNTTLYSARLSHNSEDHEIVELFEAVKKNKNRATLNKLFDKISNSGDERTFFALDNLFSWFYISFDLSEEFRETDLIRETALIIAARDGHEHIVRYLLEKMYRVNHTSFDHAININAQNNDGFSALMMAILSGNKNIVQLLLEFSNINLSVQSHNGDSVFSLAKKCPDIESIIAKHAEAISKLPEWFAAAKNGNLEKIKELSGLVNINIRDDKGNTALIYAAKQGHIPLVEFLLTIDKINVNAKNTNGYTALIMAVEDGRKNIVKLLLDNPNTNINIYDNYGNTALLQAIKNSHQDISKLLLECPKINVNIGEIRGQTALMWAAIKGQQDIIKLLLAIPGIDINKKNDCGETALMWAVRSNCFVGIKEMLENPEIDLNIQDNRGKTALLYANFKEIFCLLIESGKEIHFNIRDKDGNTPRSIADRVGFGDSEFLENKLRNLKTQAFEFFKAKDIKNLKSIINQIGSDDIISVYGEILDNAFASHNSEFIEFLLRNSQNPQELLARFPFEHIQPTSDLFKWCMDLAYLRICAHCKRENCTNKCAKCKKVYYCDSKCQKADWQKHKQICMSH